MMHLAVNKDIETKLNLGCQKVDKYEKERQSSEEYIIKLETRIKEIERNYHSSLVEREGLYNKLNDEYVEAKRLNNVL